MTATGSRSNAAPAYNPWDIYNDDEEIRHALDLIEKDFFSMLEPGIFQPHARSHSCEDGDHYMLLADLRDYIHTQERVDAAYRDVEGMDPESHPQRGPRRQVLLRPHHPGIHVRNLARGTLRWRPRFRREGLSWISHALTGGSGVKRSVTTHYSPLDGQAVAAICDRRPFRFA